ncbi:MAG: protein subunit release factor B [Chlamydiales bacterium]
MKISSSIGDNVFAPGPILLYCNNFKALLLAISEEKYKQLHKRMALLGISDDDLIEKFILASGSGGQKVNKTNSCVYLKHIPSSIEIKCQGSRSREMNRFFARRKLCERLEEINNVEKSAKQQAIEKVRRQKQRRSRRSKLRMLEDKRQHSDKKNLRKTPKTTD